MKKFSRLNIKTVEAFNLMLRQINLFFVFFLLIILTSTTHAGLRSKKPSSKAYIPKYSAVVMDAATGKILEQEDAHGIRYPASLTKIMTLYLTFEALKSGQLSLNTKMIASAKAARQIPSKFGLKAGEQITVYQAVMGLVTKSANDVAVVLAEHLAGSEEAFARRMTQKSHVLGMKDTLFKNASGVPDPTQVTSAYDMAVLSRALYRNFPEQYKYFKNQSFTHKGKVHRNHNHLLGKVQGLDGIKTGFIVASGFNLAASAVRYDAAQQPHRLITIVLGGPNRHWRDRRVTELLETNFHKMGLSSSLPPASQVTQLVLKKPRDRVLETIEDEGVFIHPAVEVIDKENDTQQVINHIIETASRQKPSDGETLDGTTNIPTSQIKPAKWVVPTPDKTESSSQALSKTRKDQRHFYKVQVGVYRKSDQARRQAQQARALLGEGQVQTPQRGRGKKKMIAAQVVGLNHHQAKDICHQFRKKGKECEILN